MGKTEHSTHKFVDGRAKYDHDGWWFAKATAL